MELKNITDSPFSWAAVGCIIGLILGVTTLSVVLLYVGLGAFLLYLRLNGPAQHETEGKLFIIGPAFMMAWVAGFVVRGLII